MQVEVGDKIRIYTTFTEEDGLKTFMDNYGEAKQAILLSDSERLFGCDVILEVVSRKEAWTWNRIRETIAEKIYGIMKQ